MKESEGVIKGLFAFLFCIKETARHKLIKHIFYRLEIYIKGNHL